MNNCKQLIAIIVLSFTLVLSACIGTERMDVDTRDADPVIVIYGCITDSLTRQEVFVGSSAPYFSDKPDPVVSGAVVRITSSGNEEFELLESDSVKGLYRTVEKIRAVAGLTYTLTVKIDFNKDGVAEEYEAKTVMQPLVRLDSVAVEYQHFSGSVLGMKYAYDMYNGFAYWQDSPGEDYYLYKIRCNDSLLSNDLSELGLLSDVLFNGNYVDKMLIFNFDDIKNKKDYSDDEIKDIVFVKQGDKISVEFSKIEEGFWNFVQQSNKERHGQAAGGYAANITTNISNGGVGYFTAYSISRATAFIP